MPFSDISGNGKGINIVGSSANRRIKRNRTPLIQTPIVVATPPPPPPPPPSPPSLTPLTLSSSASFTTGVTQSGTILGATLGSAIVGSSLPSGFTIDGPARTWAWDGTGPVSAGNFTLTETLGGYSNSPLPTNIAYTIIAAGTGMIFGTNIPPSYRGGNWAFFTELSQGAEPNSYTGGGTDQGAIPLANFDNDGYITSMPASAAKIRWQFSTPPDISGTYLLSWEGKVTPNLSDITIVALLGMTVNSSPTTTSRNVTLTVGQPSFGGIAIDYAITGANYPVRFSLKKVGATGVINASAKSIIQATSIANRRIIRTMKATGADLNFGVYTAFPPASLRLSAAERNTRSLAVFPGDYPSRVGDGPCWEDIFVSANEVGAHLYYNMQLNVEADYVTAFGNAVCNVSTGLDPARFLYLTFGNETWGGTIFGHDQMAAEGVSEGLTSIDGVGPVGGMERTIEKMSTLIDTINARFTANGRSLATFKPVLEFAAVADVNYWGQILIDYMNIKTKIKGLAFAPYVRFPDTINTGANPFVDYPNAAVAIAALYPLAIAVVNSMVGWRQFCTAHSLELIFYESMLEIIFADQTFAQAFNCHTDMQTFWGWLIQQYEMICKPDVFITFGLTVSSINTAGAYGLLEYQAQVPGATTPKYNAQANYSSGGRVAVPMIGTLNLVNAGVGNGAFLGTFRRSIKDSTISFPTNPSTAVTADDLTAADLVLRTAGGGAAYVAPGTVNVVMRESHPNLPAPGYVDTPLAITVDTAFDLATLNPVWWFDLNAARVFEDTAGTDACEDADLLARINGLGGKPNFTQATSGNRPTWRSGANAYADFDNAAIRYLIPAAEASLGDANGQRWMCVALKLDANTNGQEIINLFGTKNLGGLKIATGNKLRIQTFFNNDGSQLVVDAAAAADTSQPIVVFFQLTSTGAGNMTVDLYVDGSVVGTSTISHTPDRGLTKPYIGSDPLFSGASMDGRIYGYASGSGLLTTTQRNNTITYFGSLCGRGL